MNASSTRRWSDVPCPYQGVCGVYCGISRNKPESFRGFPSPGSDDLREILIAVFVVVTIVVAVFPIAMVMVLFGVFVPFSFFATIPLTIAPSITVTLVPFAIVPAPRHDDGKLLR
jgi:hypothetical protein